MLVLLLHLALFLKQCLSYLLVAQEFRFWAAYSFITLPSFDWEVSYIYILLGSLARKAFLGYPITFLLISVLSGSAPDDGSNCL